MGECNIRNYSTVIGVTYRCKENSKGYLRLREKTQGRTNLEGSLSVGAETSWERGCVRSPLVGGEVGWVSWTRAGPQLLGSGKQPSGHW